MEFKEKPKEPRLSLLDYLKSDMERLINLSYEIGELYEMLLWHSNLLDKRNYDKKKTERISKKLKGLQHVFSELEKKWF